MRVSSCPGARVTNATNSSGRPIRRTLARSGLVFSGMGGLLALSLLASCSAGGATLGFLAVPAGCDQSAAGAFVLQVGQGRGHDSASVAPGQKVGASAAGQ